MPRTPFACDFCYRRKTRCDNIHPPCSNCVKAGVQCLSSSRDDRLGLSRSIADRLEEFIAQLKGELSTPEFSQICNERHNLQSQLAIDSRFNQEKSQSNGSVSNSAASQSLAVHAACNSGTATSHLVIEGGHSILYDNALFTGSGLPFPFFQLHPFNHPEGCVTSLEQSRQVSEMKPLPVEVATLLFNTYIERILPHYPVFSEADAQDQFDSVYSKNPSEPSNISVFIISMILAISTLTSKAHDRYRIISLSESLHHNALRRCDFLKSADIRSLQCLLLLAQYSTYLPYTGNAWHIIGDAMRIATELGLHREVSEYNHLKPAETDLRRRLFWATYGMERSIAVTSHRTFSIKDEHISASFPLESGEIRSKADIPTTRHYRAKSQFLNYVRIRQLQSEISAVQFFCRDMEMIYEDWVISTEERISAWEQSAWLNNQGTGAPDWFSQVIWQCRLMVRRPCPRNPNPTEKSIIACFEAAIGTLRGSWELAQSGYLQCPFHNIHNSFEAGTIILYALNHYQEFLLELYGDRKIIDLIHQVSEILAAYTIGWPIATGLRQLYDELKESTIKTFMAPQDAVQDLHDLMVASKIDNIVLCRPVDTLYHNAPEVVRPVVSTDFRGRIDTPMLDGIPVCLQNVQAPPTSTSMAGFWQEGLEIDFEFGDSNFCYTGSFGELVGDYNFDFCAALPPALEIPPQRISSMHVKVSEAAQSNYQKLCKAVKAIPACTRCRVRRVKCDRNLPSCRSCQKSSADCSYHDQVTSTDVSYKYISSLWQQVKDLMDEFEGRSKVEDSSLPIADNHTERLRQNHFHIPKSMFMGEGLISWRSETEAIRPNYINTVFFGDTNAFANMAFISDLANPQALETCPYRPLGRQFKRDLHLSHPGSQLMPPEATTVQLVEFFGNSTNTFYPIFSRDDLQNICFDIYRPTGKVEPYKQQTLHLILAISLRHLGDTDPFLLSTSRSHFQSAISGLDDASNLSTLDKFPRIKLALLYCLYTQQTPSSGDIWRLIGLSCRFCLDMANLVMNDGENAIYLRLYQITYRLECDFAIALGRPPQLIDSSMQSSTNSSAQQVCTSSNGLPMHMYRLARIQGRILDHILTKGGSGKMSMHSVFAIDAVQDCYQRLSQWILNWNKDLATWKLSDPDSETLCPRGKLYGLSLWGNLLYQRLLLLLQRMSLKKLLTDAELHSIINNHIQCFKDLRSHQSALRIQYLSDLMAPAPTIYPITWTLAQSVFSVALDVLAAKAHDNSGISWDVTFRNCSVLLASLEVNENNLCEGLSRALEWYII